MPTFKKMLFSMWAIWNKSENIVMAVHFNALSTAQEPMPLDLEATHFAPYPSPCEPEAYLELLTGGTYCLETSLLASNTPIEELKKMSSLKSGVKWIQPPPAPMVVGKIMDVACQETKYGPVCYASILALEGTSLDLTPAQKSALAYVNQGISNKVWGRLSASILSAAYILLGFCGLTMASKCIDVYLINPCRKYIENRNRQKIYAAERVRNELIGDFVRSDPTSIVTEYLSHAEWTRYNTYQIEQEKVTASHRHEHDESDRPRCPGIFSCCNKQRSGYTPIEDSAGDAANENADMERGTVKWL